MEKNNKPKLFFEKTINVFAWLCLVLAVILSIISATAVISGENNGKEILGHKILIVNTDSMSKSAISENEKIFFSAGDIIIIRVINDPTELKEGDVISFFSYNPESMGKTVSHKIREIKYSSSGEITGFVTYGINKGVNDIVEVRPEHLVGKYVAKVPSVGLLFSFMKTPRGFYLSILIPGVLLIIFFSVKVGKILGKRELAKEYREELDHLKNREDMLLKKDSNNNMNNVDNCVETQEVQRNVEQNMEQNAQQVKEQSQNQSTIYQTVSINCPSSPMMAQPVVYQTAPSQSGASICQTVTMTPAPVVYQPMPVTYQQVPVQPVVYQPTQFTYQAMPVQSAPVVYQTIGANGMPITANTVSQPAPVAAPTVCQNISENGAQVIMPQIIYQPTPVQPMQVAYQTVPVQPVSVQQPVAPAPVEQQTVSPAEEETSVTTEEIQEIKQEEVLTQEKSVDSEHSEVVEEPAVKETSDEEQLDVLQTVANEDAVTEEAMAEESEKIELVGEEEIEDQSKFKIPESEKKPFAEKIASAKDETQNYFNKVHNELVSYKKVSSRVSFRCVSYRRGRTLLAKIGLRGKTLTGYFNLNVKDFNEKVYFQKDMSSVKAYEEVPFAVKIRSARACKNATKLVGALAEKFELTKIPEFKEIDVVKQIKEENDK